MEDSLGTIIINITRTEKGDSIQKTFLNVRDSEILFVAEILMEEVLQKIKNDIKARATSKNVVSEHKEMD